MNIKLGMCICGMLISCFSFASEGVVTKKSKYSVSVSAERFEAILMKKGLTVFASIDHAKNAGSVDLDLRPTRTVIFGNPKVGTPLMQCEQSVAIDLPQKLLIWEDSSGDVWLSYNKPEHLRKRHSIEGCDAVINKISQVLSKLSDAVIK